MLSEREKIIQQSFTTDQIDKLLETVEDFMSMVPDGALSHEALKAVCWHHMADLRDHLWDVLDEHRRANTP